MRLVAVGGATRALLRWATYHRLPAGVLPWAGTGFPGAYTTFSTFTLETVRLLEDGAWQYAAWNLALSGPLAAYGS
jgi:fluoride ion exporter CrcB/FEX